MFSEEAILDHCSKCSQCNSFQECLFKEQKATHDILFVKIPIDADRKSSIIRNVNCTLQQLMKGLDNIQAIMGKNI